jgi:hypothetical protein
MPYTSKLGQSLKGTVMTLQIFGCTLLCSITLLAFSCHSDKANSNSTTATLAANSTPTPTQPSVHKIFAVTDKDLRQAYDDYEAKGEKQQTVSLGQKQSLFLTAQTFTGGTETLKLTVMFLSPLDQARGRGYQFGLVAKQRTPEDRKDSENASISLIRGDINQVAFRVWLDQPKDPNASLPSVSYELIDKDGNRIKATTDPGAPVLSGKDLIGDVALAEDGAPLTFPLLNGTAPNLTNTMTKMVVVVKIDAKEANLEFKL